MLHLGVLGVFLFALALSLLLWGFGGCLFLDLCTMCMQRPQIPGESVRSPGTEDTV